MFLGFINVNFKIPDIFQGFFFLTIWSGNFIKVQNNFVYLLPEKKCELSLFRMFRFPKKNKKIGDFGVCVAIQYNDLNVNHYMCRVLLLI